MALRSSATGASTICAKKLAESVTDDFAGIVAANCWGVHQRLKASANKRLLPAEWAWPFGSSHQRVEIAHPSNRCSWSLKRGIVPQWPPVA